MLTDEMKAQGWVEHDGGPCPVEEGSRPAMMERSGYSVPEGREFAYSGRLGLRWRWDEGIHSLRDIIAYKPEQPNG